MSAPAKERISLPSPPAPEETPRMRSCRAWQLATGITWQWEHTKGWRDYAPDVCRRIEDAFQLGAPSVRAKSGKFGGTPMEIIFSHMRGTSHMQYNPVSGNDRAVRRVGKDTRFMKIMRFFRKKIRLWLVGSNHESNFAKYSGAAQIERLRELVAPEESLMDQYMKEGFFARIARSGWFALCSILLILSNAVWLGYEADHNDAATIWAAEARFQVMEHFYATAFTVELVIRFCALKSKRRCFLDPWFTFDFMLVALMVGEIWVMLPIWLAHGGNDDPDLGSLTVFRLLRLLRLAKIGRVARLLRLIHELMTLMKGFFRAMKRGLITICLLIVLLYLFGIIFKTQAENHPELNSQFFSKVGDSMLNLLLYGTFLDAIAEMVNALREDAYDMLVLFLVFVLLSAFTLLNILIGTICEVVTQVSREERDRSAVHFLRQNILTLLQVHDRDNDGEINRDEFKVLVCSPDMDFILHQFEVDTQDLVSLTDVLYETRKVVVAEDDGDMSRSSTAASVETTPAWPDPEKLRIVSVLAKSLSFGEIMQVILRLRSGNGAAVRDIVELRRYVKNRLDELQKRVTKPYTKQTSGGSSTRSISGGPSGLFHLPLEGGPTSGPPPELVRKLTERLASLREELRGLREQVQRLEDPTTAPVQRPKQ